MLLAASDFLIPNGTLLVDVVIFLAVLAVVSKWILPPLLEVSQTRRAGIRAALAAAEEARAKRAEAFAERESVLAEARNEARAIIDGGNQAAEAARAAARERGSAEFNARLVVARGEIEAERERARADLVGRLDTIVVAAAERIVGSRVDLARHRAVLDEAVAAASAAGAPDAAGRA